jgi:hypothetical protein
LSICVSWCVDPGSGFGQAGVSAASRKKVSYPEKAFHIDRDLAAYPEPDPTS